MLSYVLSCVLYKQVISLSIKCYKVHRKTGDVNKETVNWHHIYSLNKLLYSKMSHDVRYEKDEKVSGEWNNSRKT